jgi:hypothetical protein
MVKLWPPRGHGRRMRILLLDADMAIDDADWSTFESTQSLYDYDLVLWDPFRSMKPYPKRGYGAGSSNGLVRLRNDIARRQLDFAKFLKLVRTIVTFLPSDVGLRRLGRAPTLGNRTKPSDLSCRHACQHPGFTTRQRETPNQRKIGPRLSRADSLPGSPRFSHCPPRQSRGAFPQSLQRPAHATRVVSLLADLLRADRVEVEHHAVIDVDRADVTDNSGEMLGGDGGVDGVGVLRRPPYPVGGQEDSVLEDEGAGVGRLPRYPVVEVDEIAFCTTAEGAPSPGLVTH